MRLKNKLEASIKPEITTDKSHDRNEDKKKIDKTDKKHKNQDIKKLDETD